MGRLQVFTLLGGSDLITLVVVAAIVWGLGTCRFPLSLAAYHLHCLQKSQFSMGLAANRSPSIRCTRCRIALRLRHPTPAYWQREPTTCSTSVAGSTSPKDRKSCTCRISPGATTACSSPTHRTALNFAYVGKRTTGTEAGDYLISGQGWQGNVPQGVKQISSPNNSVLVFGRVFVESDSDLPTAYGLAKQIQLTPLSQ